MKKIIFIIILICFASTTISAQIVEQENISYNGSPGEPILQRATNSLIKSIAKTNYRRYGGISLHDLEVLTKRFPNLKNYKIVVDVTTRYTGSGKLVCEGADAHYASGRWISSGVQFGVWDPERDRGIGIYDPDDPSTFYEDNYYIITRY